MNLEQLVNIVYSKASPYLIKKGEELYTKGFVKKVNSKRIDNIYHIYGSVEDEKRGTINDTHIKINLANKNLEGVKCSCKEFHDFSKENITLFCDHIMATTAIFYNKAKNKVKSKDESEKKKFNNGDILLNRVLSQSNKKEEINFEVRLKNIVSQNTNYYEVEFRVGKNITYVLTDIISFIRNTNKNLPSKITNDFIFNPNIHTFSEDNIKIIKFIEEYISISNFYGASNVQVIKGRSLIIFPEALRRFLELCRNKKINFKYEQFDGPMEVVKSNIPLAFTLKSRNNLLLLSTHKNIPIPLTNRGEVYFYDRKLYMPSSKQDEVYVNLYAEFKNKGVITFSNSKSNFEKIVSLIERIAKQFSIDDSVRTYLDNYILPKFYFYKDNDEIICKVEMKYGDKNVDILEENNNQESLIRDGKREEKLIMELERYSFIKRNDKFKFIGSEEELFDFLTQGIKYFKTLGMVTLQSNFLDNQLYSFEEINSLDINEFDDGIEIRLNGSQLEFQEFNDIYNAIENNERYYKNKKNKFFDLTDESIVQYINFLELIGGSDKLDDNSIKIDKSKAIYVEQFVNKNSTFTKGNEVLTTISKKLSNLNDKDINVPDDLNATLRDYQIYGYKWMKSLAHLEFGGILADEMGLGKTIQTITFLLSEQEKKSLIVTPTSLIYNWGDEFKRFAPNLKVALIHGNKSDRQKMFENIKEYDVIITTYNTLRMDFENYKDLNFDYFIIDEAQNIKNPMAQNAQNVKQINASVKFALTGTPIENNLLEMWSIFDFVMQGYLFNEKKFKDKFIKSDKNIDELKILVKPFILRRLKSQVITELPDKIEKKFIVEMPTSQKLIYKSYLKQIKDKLKEHKEDRITIFSYLTKLRQLCLDPSIIVDEYKGESGKIKIARELVRESIADNKKILLFSQFTSVLKNIGDVLDKESIEYVYLDGSIKAKDRIDLVNEFNNNEKIRVFLISLKAGGTGLNLTSANMVIHFDPWWNPAIEDQATDRAHRIGQRNIVEVIKLVAQGTIEEKIILLQEEKKELINSIIGDELNEGMLSNKLTENEILSLFE